MLARLLKEQTPLTSLFSDMSGARTLLSISPGVNWMYEGYVEQGRSLTLWPWIYKHHE